MIRKFMTLSITGAAIVLAQSLFAQFDVKDINKIVPSDAKLIIGASPSQLYDMILDAEKLQTGLSEKRKEFDEQLAQANIKVSDLKYFYFFVSDPKRDGEFALAIKTKIKLPQIIKLINTIEDSGMTITQKTDELIIKSNKSSDVFVVKQKSNDMIICTHDEFLNWANVTPKTSADILKKIPKAAATSFIWGAITIPASENPAPVSTGLGENDIKFIDFAATSAKKDISINANIETVDSDKALTIKKQITDLTQMLSLQLMSEPELLAMVQKAINVSTAGNVVKIKVDYTEKLGKALSEFQEKTEKASNVNIDIDDMEIELEDEDSDDVDAPKPAVKKSVAPAKK